MSSTWPSRPASPRRSTGWRRSVCSARPSSTLGTVDDTLGAVVKERDDLELVREQPRGDRLRCVTTAVRRACSSSFARRAARRRASPVGSGDVLTYCGGHGGARPDRPARPLLGGPHHAGDAARPDPDLRPRVPALLPRRGRGTARAVAIDRHGRRRDASRSLQIPATEPRPDDEARDEEAQLGLMASDAEIWRDKSFAACTPDELAALRRIMARIRADATAPLHAPHGRRPATAAGRTCAGRSARRCACTASRRRCSGAVAGCGTRPLVLILDVSGSMSDYSRGLLQFAYSTRRADLPGRGLLLRDPARPGSPRHSNAADPTRRSIGRRRRCSTGRAAPASANRSTRSCATWGRRGHEPGCDRRDLLRRARPRRPGVLAAAMERLVAAESPGRVDEPPQGHDRDFRPSTLGMMVAAPHVDVIMSGHDLRSLESSRRCCPQLRWSER